MGYKNNDTWRRRMNPDSEHYNPPDNEVSVNEIGEDKDTQGSKVDNNPQEHSNENGKENSEGDDVEIQLSREIENLESHFDYFAGLDHGGYPDPFSKINQIRDDIEIEYEYNDKFSETQRDQLLIQLEKEKKELIGFMLGYVENELLSLFSHKKERTTTKEAKERCEEYLSRIQEVLDSHKDDLYNRYSSKISSLEDKIDRYSEEPSAYDVEKKCSELKTDLMELKDNKFSGKLFKLEKDLDLEHTFISVGSIRSKLDETNYKVSELRESKELEQVEDESIKNDLLREIENIDSFVEQLEDAIKFLEKYYELVTLSNKFERGEVESSDLLDIFEEMKDIYGRYYSDHFSQKDLSYTERGGEGMKIAITSAKKILDELGVKNFTSDNSTTELTPEENTKEDLEILNLDPSEISGLSKKAALKKVKEKRNELAVRYHPDMGENPVRRK